MRMLLTMLVALSAAGAQARDQNNYNSPDQYRSSDQYRPRPPERRTDPCEKERGSGHPSEHCRPPNPPPGPSTGGSIGTKALK